MLLVVLFVVLSNAVRQSPLPAANMDDSGVYIAALMNSIKSINSVEYRRKSTTIGLGNKKTYMDIHYYYNKPYYLRVETAVGSNNNVDIYTPEGMYEYFPASSTAYFREKWKDEKPMLLQLEDILQDIDIRGKYDYFKTEAIRGKSAQVIRSVYDDRERIYEHRIWISSVDGLQLPVKEEFLTDGDTASINEYEYISINREIPDAVFTLKPSKNLQIFNAEGVPKLVKDKAEAEKYVKFNVIMPGYIPEGFTISEMCVVPPAKTPSILITYISGLDTIYISEKKTGKNDIEVMEGDKPIEAEGKKFIVKKVYDGSTGVEWMKDGIEFEVCGPNSLKNEIVKITHSLSKVWVTLE